MCINFLRTLIAWYIKTSGSTTTPSLSQTNTKQFYEQELILERKQHQSYFIY